MLRKLSVQTFAALGGLSGIGFAAGHFLCDIDVPVDGVSEVLWPGLCASIHSHFGLHSSLSHLIFLPCAVVLSNKQAELGTAAHTL